MFYCYDLAYEEAICSAYEVSKKIINIIVAECSKTRIRCVCCARVLQLVMFIHIGSHEALR